MKGNRAFTLAEVLITIGIIGVVAAMTIPNLLTKMDRDKKIATVRKAQSILNQAIKLSTIDNEDYEAWDASLPPREYLDKYYTPYMKVIAYCDTYAKCNYKSAAPWSRYNGSNSLLGLTHIAEFQYLPSMEFYIQFPKQEEAMIKKTMEFMILTILAQMVFLSM